MSILSQLDKGRLTFVTMSSHAGEFNVPNESVRRHLMIRVLLEGSRNTKIHQDEAVFVHRKAEIFGLDIAMKITSRVNMF